MGLNLNHLLASSDRENGPQRHSVAVTLPSDSSWKMHLVPPLKVTQLWREKEAAVWGETALLARA